MKYEIMSRMRPEECERSIIFMLNKARLEFFLEKYNKIRALKFII